MISSTVQSSTVARVGWENESLFVEFHNRGNPTFYKYDGVPFDKYGAATQAESVGKYLVAEIKPNYPYEQLQTNPFH